MTRHQFTRNKDKDKDRTRDEYEELKDEMVVDKVTEIFRDQPGNYIAALEEVGFVYVEEEDDNEEIEEMKAKPENQNQRVLVTYFEGTQDPSDAILATFLTERDTEHPKPAPDKKVYQTGESTT